MANFLTRAMTLNMGSMQGVTSMADAAANVMQQRNTRRDKLADIADENARQLDYLKKKVDADAEAAKLRRTFEGEQAADRRTHEEKMQDDRQLYDSKYADARLELQKKDSHVKYLALGLDPDTGKPTGASMMPLNQRAKLVGNRMDDVSKQITALMKEYADPNADATAKTYLLAQIQELQGQHQTWSNAYSKMTNGEEITAQDFNPNPGGQGGQGGQGDAPEYDPMNMYGQFGANNGASPLNNTPGTYQANGSTDVPMPQNGSLAIDPKYFQHQNNEQQPFGWNYDFNPPQQAQAQPGLQAPALTKDSGFKAQGWTYDFNKPDSNQLSMQTTPDAKGKSYFQLDGYKTIQEAAKKATGQEKEEYSRLLTDLINMPDAEAQKKIAEVAGKLNAKTDAKDQEKWIRSIQETSKSIFTGDPKYKQALTKELYGHFEDGAYPTDEQIQIFIMKNPSRAAKIAKLPSGVSSKYE